MGKKVEWTEQAKTDLRAIEQSTALHILHSLARYAAVGEGDVKRLRSVEPPELGFALATIASASTTSVI